MIPAGASLRIYFEFSANAMDNVVLVPSSFCQPFCVGLRPVAGTPQLSAWSSLSLDTQAAARPQVPRRQLRLDSLGASVGRWR